MTSNKSESPASVNITHHDGSLAAGLFQEAAAFSSTSSSGSGPCLRVDEDAGNTLMGPGQWEKYYARSLARRGSLRSEDCYCSAEEIMRMLHSCCLLPQTRSQALVVGCGTSELPALLAGSTCSVTALDISPTVVGWMQSQHAQVIWHAADATSMDKTWRGRFHLLVDKGLLSPLAAEDALDDANPACSGEAAAGVGALRYRRVVALLGEYRRVLHVGGTAVVITQGEAPWLSTLATATTIAGTREASRSATWSKPTCKASWDDSAVYILRAEDHGHTTASADSEVLGSSLSAMD